MAKLSAELQRYFFEEERQESVKLADLLELAQERIFGFLFVLISIPSALPVPAAGYSIPFAIVIFLLAVQLVAGAQKPWLPTGMLNKAIALKTARGFAKAGIPWLRRFEAISRPRLSGVCTSVPGRTIIGLAIALMSVSMMIPIPLTNTLPAIGICVTGFGLVEDDGVLTLLGLLLCLLGAALTTAVLLTLLGAIDFLNDFLKERLEGALPMAIALPRH